MSPSEAFVMGAHRRVVESWSTDVFVLVQESNKVREACYHQMMSMQIHHQINKRFITPKT